MLSGIITTKTGIELTYTDTIKTTLTSALIVSDKALVQGDCDVYFHKYVNSAMKNPNRIAVLTCHKGYVPEKEWWISKGGTK